MVNLAAFLVFSAAGYGIRMSRADKKRAMGPQEKRKVSEMNMEEKQLKRARRHISQTQFIAYGFFCLIMTGALLLMLPISSRDGQSEDFFKLSVYRYQRLLCDRTDCQGYLDPVVFVWTDGDYDDDTDRRSWVCNGWRVYFHCAQTEDRIKRERSFAGKRQYLADRRSCKAGERDYKRNLSL